MKIYTDMKNRLLTQKKLCLMFLLAIVGNMLPLMAQYQVGDIITNSNDGTRGVVFWVAPDGSGGWMVALNDEPGTYKWSRTNGSILTEIPAPIGGAQNSSWDDWNAITSDMDGEGNTAALRAAGDQSDYPAAWAVDYAHGWYLPSAGQLSKLFAAQGIIGTVLRSNGGSELNTSATNYWSSTPISSSQAWTILSNRGTYTPVNKIIAKNVRAIRNFTSETIIYDTTLSYTWNTGETTPAINVQPDVTTQYTVTAESGMGCRATATQNIFVNSTDPQYFLDTICAGEPYTGNGYQIPAEDNVNPGDTLVIRHISAGACEATIYLNLHKKPIPDSTSVTVTLCHNERYIHNGIEYSTTGDYTQVLQGENGCDSIIHIHLTILPNIPTTYINDTICRTTPYTTDGYTENGFYITPAVIENATTTTQTITLESANHCDSVVVLNLVINPILNAMVLDTICSGEEYHNHNFDIYANETVDTSYLIRVQHTTSSVNCDSVTSLLLTIFPHTDTVAIDTIVENQLNYTWNDSIFYGPDTIVTVIPNANGCDSTITMILNVLYNVTDTIRDTICANDLNPYWVWNDSLFYHSDTINTLLPTDRGVDSLLTMILVVNDTNHVVDRDTIGEDLLPYTWIYGNNNEFSHEFPSAGTHLDTLPNMFGCDSIITLDLIVLPNIHDTLRDTICADAFPTHFGPFDFDTVGEQIDTATGEYGVLTITHYFVHEYDLPVITDISGYSNPICPNAADQIINATTTDGTLPYTYIWNSNNLVSSNNNTATIQIAGSNCGDSIAVYLAVADANSCMAHDTAWLVANDTTAPVFSGTVDIQPALVSNCIFSIPDVTDLIRDISSDNCTATADLAIVQEPVAGSEIQNGLNNGSISGDSTVTVTVTDLCGNVSTTTVTIHYEATLTLQAGVKDARCFNTATGVILDTIDGNSVPFTIYYRNIQGDTIHTATTSGSTPIIDSLNNLYAGTYSIVVIDTNGCSVSDTVTIEQLEDLVPGTISDNQTLCEGNAIAELHGDEAAGGAAPVYEWQVSTDGTTFTPATATNDQQNYQPTETQPGDYYFRRAWIDDCGTVYSDTVHITIHPIFDTTIYDAVCEGAGYDTLGLLLSSEQTIGVASIDTTLNLAASTTCDSVVHFEIGILHHTDTTITQTIIENQLPYDWVIAGDTFHFEAADTQMTVIPNVAGCDSNITLIISVLENVSTVVDSTICDDALPLTWNNVTFNGARSESVTLTAANGTDSTILMNVYVNPTYHINIHDTINERQLPYEFDGTSYNNDVTNLIINAQSQFGCDSTTDFSLTIIRDTAEYDTTAICASDFPQNWHGHDFTEPQTVIDTVVGTYGDYHLYYYTVLSNPMPTITDITGFTNPICPTAPDQTLTATVTDGTAPYTYTWSSDRLTASSHETADIQISGATCGENIPVYLAITDANNCAASDTVTLIVDDTVAPVITGTVPTQGALVSNCVYTVPDVTTLVRNISSDNCTATADLQIIQTPAAGDELLNGLSGTAAINNEPITVTVTDQCGNVDSTIVIVHYELSLTIAAGVRDAYCYDTPTGTIFDTIDGNNTPFVITITDDNDNVIHTTTTTGSAPIIDSLNNMHAGTYTITVNDDAGCEISSIVTINQLDELIPGTIYDDQILCEGQTIAELTGDEATGGVAPTYQWQISYNGTTFVSAAAPNHQQNYLPAETTPGTYYYRRAWIDDCGTVYTNVVTVIINPAQEEYIFAQVCTGDIYNSNGFNITETDEAGTFNYLDTLQTSNGCDSIVTLQLTVLPHTDTTLSQTIIENQLPYPWIAGGHTFTFTEADTMSTVTQNTNGCDSTITLILNVLENVSSEIDSTICDNQLPLTWNGIVFQTAGDQNVTIPAANGTDSTILMHLHVNPTSTTVINDTVNERQLPRIFDNTPYYNDVTNYTITIPNQYSCDSTVTFSLVVIRDTSIYDTTAVCASNFPTRWQGFNFDSASTIIDTVVGNYGNYFLYYHTVNAYSVPVITDINGFTNPICPTAADQVLTATVEEGTTPYSYTWNNYHIIGTNNNTATVQIAGSYCGENIPVNLTVTDANGCVATHDVTLTVNDTVAPTITDTVPEQDALVSNCVFSVPDVTALVRAIATDNCTATADLQISQYPTANSIIYENTQVEVTVTDGCYNTTTTYVNVTFIQDFSINVSTVDVRCYGDNNGSARVDVVGTATPYSYQWSDNYGTISTIDSITNLYEGNYTISVTDANGCNIVRNVNIGHLFDEMYAGTIYDNQSLCIGTPFGMLTGTVATGGNDSYYQWQVSTDGTNFTPVAEPNNTQDYQPEGNASEDLYFRRAWISDECGTLYSNTVHMAVHPLYADTLYDSICEGNAYHNNGFDIYGNETVGTELVERTRTEYSQYGCDSLITIELTILHNTYSTISDTIVENSLPHTFNGVTYYSDTYNDIITIPNANGCDSIIQYTLIVLRNTAETIDTTICRNQLPLTWHGLTYLDAGSQQLTVLNPDGTDHVITYQLFINDLPSINTINGYANPICPNVQYQTVNSIVSGGSAPYSYNWSGSNILDATSSNTLVQIEGSSCGDQLPVILTVTDYNGCSISDTAVLIVNDTIAPTIWDSIPAQAAAVSNCVFSIPELTEMVRYIAYDNCIDTYALNITQNPQVGTLIATETVVAVTVTDLCGNTATTHIHVTVPDTISVTPTIVDVRCFGENNGSAQITATGGTPPYNYSWVDINTGNIISYYTSINNQPEGDYELTITDVNNCTYSQIYHIGTLYDEMIVGSISSDQSLCYGEVIADLMGTPASGGHDSYYEWQMSTDNTTFTAAPGTNNLQDYTVTETATRTLYFRRAWISDDCGTLYSDTVTIIANPIYSDTIIGNVCQDYAYTENDFNIDVERTHVPGVITEVQNLTTAAGCDSIRTLILTVNPTLYDTLFASVCQGESFNDWGFNIAAADIPDPGTFEFAQTLTAVTGCDSLVTLYVTVMPKYEQEHNEIVCEGMSYNAHGFEISANETIGQTQIIRTQFLTTHNGCDSIITLTLTVIDTAIAVVTLTEDFCENYSAVLSVVSNMQDFIWSNGLVGNEIEVTEPGRYVVTASQDGCTARAAINIPDCEFELYLPNCITTTNEDGLNDYFYIPEYNQRSINDFEICIFNRWGQLIYRSNDKHFEWHGDYKGKVFHNMVYTYVINCTNHTGKKFQYKGTITVL